MRKIKIRSSVDGDWVSVELLDDDSRPGWFKIKGDAEAEWVRFERLHPADQVALRAERIAKQRYEWVPKEDLE